MFSGLGLSEIMIVLLVTLVVIGPEKIPEVARMLGKGLREVRRASGMFRDMLMLEEDDQPTGGAQTYTGADASGEHELVGTVAHHADYQVTVVRPVLLEPPRRAQGTTTVALEDAKEPAACAFEPLPAASS